MSKHTPGPWAWFGNAGSNSLYLATTHSGRRYVMGFKRWGMRGAQPQFQPNGHGLVDASELLEFEVGNRGVRGLTQAKADPSVYRLDITGIDCADARLIAAAPELLTVAEMAAAQFEFYAEQHEAKGTPEADAKAKVNREKAAQCRAAIAKAKGETA